MCQTTFTEIFSDGTYCDNIAQPSIITTGVLIEFSIKGAAKIIWQEAAEETKVADYYQWSDDEEPS